MTLKLRVTSGPLKGQEFFLAPGFGIGRSKGDVRINDQKVSSLHAFVVDSNGTLVLTDNGSKNGIRMKGKKVREVVLKEGISFQIGIHSFQVIKAPPQAKKPAPVAPQATSPITEEAPLGSPEPEGNTTTHHPLSDPIEGKEKVARPRAEAKAKPWEQVMATFTEKVLSELKDHPKTVTPFDPAVRLNFVSGMQTETVWILGYGPRIVGAASVDLPIFEPEAPPVCFEVVPSAEGVTFRTNYPKQVTINGESVRQKVLAAGDTIAVGETRIEVELIR